jgi:hypothetical protein
MNQYLQKWLQSFSIVVIVFLIITIFSLNNQKNSAYRITKNQIDVLKERSDNLIKSKERQIDYLIKRNVLIDLEIKKKQKLIDSLEKVKKTIQVVYINNVKEIREFNAKQLENYFRNEIK